MDARRKDHTEQIIMHFLAVQCTAIVGQVFGEVLFVGLRNKYCTILSTSSLQRVLL